METFRAEDGSWHRVVYAGHAVEMFVPARLAGDHIARCHAAGRFYETSTLFYRGMLDDLYERYRGGAIVDGGASIGNHTAFFVNILGAETLAVEPLPEALSVLVRSAMRWGAASQKLLHVSPLALSAGKALYARSAKEDGNIGMTSFFEPAEDAPAAPLFQTDSLDNIIFRLRAAGHFERVGVVKLDLEGGEEEALLGALALLRRDRPMLYLEARDAVALARLDLLLSSVGYSRSGGPFNATPMYRWESFL